MTSTFGTDGVRGPADDLSDGFVVALGRAAARVLGGDRFVVGRDPRESGPRIVAALQRGLEAEGVRVDQLGVVPTPAVAGIARAEDIPGAMVSASHNPYTDNGIKFFAAGGRKLTDEVERRFEAVLAELTAAGTDEPPDGTDGAPGEAPDAATPVPGDEPDHEGLDRYAASVVASTEGRRLDGLAVVIDCANGSASAVAPTVLRTLGATVDVLHADPDGRNINQGCGSTHPGDLQAAVVARGAALGLAFDGDADRVLAVDHTGALVDGDQILAMLAVDLRDRGRLAADTVVVTVMSNLGFRLGMAERGITVIDTKVGDRYVLEALEAGSLSLGGEQSGHVILRDLATTGDGLLTAVQVLDLVARSGRSLADLASVMTRLPQVLRNVRVATRGVDGAALIAAEVAEAEAELGATGRVLVRSSGTEPLVRVMVEAADADQADAVAARLADLVAARA